MTLLEAAAPNNLPHDYTLGMVSIMRDACRELRSTQVEMEKEVVAITRAFTRLAAQTDEIRQLAAAIVDCVENENIGSVLSKVQRMGATARDFVENRLQATAGILETVAAQVSLLRQLSQLTGSQAAIALETKALSVLTNIEAARLGSVGAGFQYLAHELDDFSKTLTIDTAELATQTEARRSSIDHARIMLGEELPQMRGKLTRVEGELTKDLFTLNSGLTQLSSTPARFRGGVQHISQQISGIVAAVQSHDITRQQLEHVEQALELMAGRLDQISVQVPDPINDQVANQMVSSGDELSQAYAGILIQVFQLENIKEKFAEWTTQIKDCLSAILAISASEIVAIAPQVLEREREISAQLGHIALLETESQAYCDKIQVALADLSNLMQLVNEHMQESKAVRNRLRMLSFNSIIEASRLGKQAGAILAIARNIKEISAEWSMITEQSSATVQQIQELVKGVERVMDVFSEASALQMREAQAQTTTALGNLRTAGAFAAQQAERLNSATENMQADGKGNESTKARLQACFVRVDEVLGQLARLKLQMEDDNPCIKSQYDIDTVERLFSAFYTTEIERSVMRAALRGIPVPVSEYSFAGNSVELF
jgi:hypothetical protein